MLPLLPSKRSSHWPAQAPSLAPLAVRCEQADRAHHACASSVTRLVAALANTLRRCVLTVLTEALRLWAVSGMVRPDEAAAAILASRQAVDWGQLLGDSAGDAQRRPWVSKA